MATLIIDTHNFITRLKAAGMDEKQAAALADGLKEIDFKHMATKQDIAELKADMFKSGFFALLAQAALIVALIQLFGG